MAACIKAWRAARNQPASWQLNGGGGSASVGGYSSGYALRAGGVGAFLSGGAVAGNADGDNGSDSRLVYPGLSVQSIRVALQRFRCAPVSSKKTEVKEPNSAALTCAQGLDSGATGPVENGSNRNTTTGRAKDQEQDEENYADEEKEGKGGEAGAVEGGEDDERKAPSVEEECPICLEELSSDPPLNLGGAAHDQQSSGSNSSSNGARHGTVTLEDLLVGNAHGSSSSRGNSRKEGGGHFRGVILATPCGGCEGTHEGSNSIAGGASIAGRSSGTGGNPVVNNISGGAIGCHGRRHAFHALCLCDWLRRSCRCPLCKTDLRPFLREE